MQLKLTVEYDGSAFQGWQVQPTGPTVQGALEQAIATVLRFPVRVHGGGRTDSGVHAIGQVAAVSVPEVPRDLGRFRASINGLVPRELAVVDVTVVGDDFDPRRHARRRRYTYRVWNREARSPLWRRFAWHVPATLDDEAMRTAAASLLGTQDFESFRASDPEPVTSTVREVFTSRIEREGPLIVYTIEASAFLKHMVRNIVGTLAEVGRGVRSPTTIPQLLAARDRRLAAPTAPAHGLVLVAIDY